MYPYSLATVTQNTIHFVAINPHKNPHTYIHSTHTPSLAPAQLVRKPSQKLFADEFELCMADNFVFSAEEWSEMRTICIHPPLSDSGMDTCSRKCVFAYFPLITIIYNVHTFRECKHHGMVAKEVTAN